MMKVLGIVLVVFLCVFMFMFIFLCVFMLMEAIGAVFLNLFDRIDDERPEDEI